MHICELEENPTPRGRSGHKTTRPYDTQLRLFDSLDTERPGCSWLPRSFRRDCSPPRTTTVGGWILWDPTCEHHQPPPRHPPNHLVLPLPFRMKFLHQETDCSNQTMSSLRVHPQTDPNALRLASGRILPTSRKSPEIRKTPLRITAAKRISWSATAEQHGGEKLLETQKISPSLYPTLSLAADALTERHKTLHVPRVNAFGRTSSSS